MSQPQPLKKSSTGTIIVVVIVVVALVAGLGAYGTYRILQTNSTGSTATTTTGQHIIEISGSSLTETVPIDVDSTVNMSCNYCNISLHLSATSVGADLNISGNYNHITITGGQYSISVSGNYDVVNAGQTVVLSVQNSGTGNTINR